MPPRTQQFQVAQCGTLSSSPALSDDDYICNGLPLPLASTPAHDIGHGGTLRIYAT
ncbi:hypothetical protein EXIGLDRAFT_723045 [Exidia glandulosa HHB12029]|uniref:Uncharacterized protein n=1 Tax=Exidia glandulosa HHB12029 TaxID=1314781 RepID=A0A165EZ65_EXIGL|nr:hypothetical protein EXIGLDRAFT_723045 [Exidia glandulosa HHB12029]